MGKFEWSKYQLNIFESVLNTDKNIVVNATAGSSKTTVLVEISKILPKYKSSVFLAFNNHIAKELSLRIPESIMCSTIHSLGIKSMMSFFKTNFKINEYKSFMFIDEVLGDRKAKFDSKELQAYKFNIKDAVNIVRLTLTKLNESDIFETCMKYNIDLSLEHTTDVISVIKKMDIYNRSFSKRHNVIDYVDMIYVPISNEKIKLPNFDFIMLDEAQDASKCIQMFINKISHNKTRTIVVGDSFQSIYSFIGADSEAFENFSKKSNSIILPLSISYRCPKNVVTLAKTICSTIEHSDFAINGEVRTGTIEEISEGDFVLCRNNRPLFSLYFQLLKMDKNPILVGANIQEGLENLVSKYINSSVEQGNNNLRESLSKLEKDLLEKGIKKPKENQKYQDHLDKIKTIEIIGLKHSSMRTVYTSIAEMFKEKDKCIKLMTIHGSKGLEADRVFLIERFDGKRLMPSPYAMKDWEIIQERNLKFVAVTRCKKSLIFIPNVTSKE